MRGVDATQTEPRSVSLDPQDHLLSARCFACRLQAGLQEWRTIIASFEDCSIIMIIYSHNDEIMTDAYGCVFNILVFSFGQP